MTLLPLVADALVLLHFLWIVFLVAGALPGRRHVWVRRLHLAGLALAAVLTGAGWMCPLTYVEVWLRQLSGDFGYAETFVRHYVEPLVYLNIPRWSVLAGIVVVVAVTWCLYRKPYAGRSGDGSG